MMTPLREMILRTSELDQAVLARDIRLSAMEAIDKFNCRTIARESKDSVEANYQKKMKMLLGNREFKMDLANRFKNLKEEMERQSRVASKLFEGLPKVRDTEVEKSGIARGSMGWDLYAVVGTSCYAVTAGQVVWASLATGYGKGVVLKLTGQRAEGVARMHGATDLYALYAHLSGYFMGVGETVEEGAMLGATGMEGDVAGDMLPHLRFEIRTTGELIAASPCCIDPVELLGHQAFIPMGDDLSRVKGMFSETNAGRET